LASHVNYGCELKQVFLRKHLEFDQLSATFTLHSIFTFSVLILYMDDTLTA